MRRAQRRLHRCEPGTLIKLTGMALVLSFGDALDHTMVEARF